MDKLIERKAHLDQLAMWCEEEMIKVVTGVRRCGKSTLFELYIDRLKTEGVTDEQRIAINLEDEDFSELLDYKKYPAMGKISARPNCCFFAGLSCQLCRYYVIIQNIVFQRVFISLG